MPDPEKVAAIRALLPATGAGIYLNAGSAGPMPAETQLAMDELAARELAIGRASPDGFEEVQQRWAELRASIAAVIVGGPRRRRDDPLHDRRHEPRDQRAPVARG